ncbi:MAG: pyridoxal 5'-phosphate synthase glutaminase subunit PdxT [Anaerolineae bacterium]|nr:pyridoxal 5'-phosphate synthase glutaminase subunit PdxT [Anaerolineae bacterium]MCX8066388.1 pyridoxal 5'-phosphate synthase glutaminase subunit PdxT [Anaerolineae bacterium]MDW7991386.1 pyridoxal 5'-phosphate synthase glutaminase subunit PdxT [Anaerolineae bacterium]
MKIGVLALQGAFLEHEAMLRRLGVQTRQVRLPRDLEGLDGLIIPGGESTSIGYLAERRGLLEPLREFALSGRPVWGTCAGMILLAREIVDGIPGQPVLGLMDITVRRNAFGRQVNSFETDLEVPTLGDPPFPAVFIRAPVIERVGPEVEVLARLEEGSPVAVRQGNLLATAFHPELTTDARFHRYFLGLGR